MTTWDMDYIKVVSVEHFLDGGSYVILFEWHDSHGFTIRANHSLGFEGDRRPLMVKTTHNVIESELHMGGEAERYILDTLTNSIVDNNTNLCIDKLIELIKTRSLDIHPFKV